MIRAAEGLVVATRPLRHDHGLGVEPDERSLGCPFVVAIVGVDARPQKGIDRLIRNSRQEDVLSPRNDSR